MTSFLLISGLAWLGIPKYCFAEFACGRPYSIFLLMADGEMVQLWERAGEPACSRDVTTRDPRRDWDVWKIGRDETETKRQCVSRPRRRDRDHNHAWSTAKLRFHILLRVLTLLSVQKVGLHVRQGGCTLQMPKRKYFISQLADLSWAFTQSARHLGSNAGFRVEKSSWRERKIENKSLKCGVLTWGEARFVLWKRAQVIRYKYPYQRAECVNCEPLHR
jgi:hypothetical protein